MVSKTFRIVLFFVILASISYGCTAANSQLQDSSSVASLSGPQAAQQAIAPALTECNNIALGKAADASSNSPQAGLAVDGSAATLWNATAYVPQWIEINLGSLNSIDEIRLNVAQSPAGDTTHQI